MKKILTILLVALIVIVLFGGALVVLGSLKSAWDLKNADTIKGRMEEIDEAIEENTLKISKDAPVINTDKEDLEPDYSWFKEGSGTKEKPYEISSPAQLLAFSNLSNGDYVALNIDHPLANGDPITFDETYFVQTKNIDMGGYNLKPICLVGDTGITLEYGYANIYYNGQGHYISNFKQVGYECGGLFAKIGWQGGEIRDLHLKNVRIDSDGDAGGLACFISEGMNIIGCSIDEDSVIEGRLTNAGGIVCYANGQSMGFETNILYCQNDAQVIGEKYVGGIVGQAQSMRTLTVQYCGNRGDLLLRNTKGDALPALGGIIGRMGEDPDAKIFAEYMIDHCYNKAEFEVGTPNSIKVGGIVGFCDDVAGTVLSVVDCVNTCTWNDVLDNSCVFAIVGWYSPAKVAVEMTRCYATSTLEFGGLISEMDNQTVTDCKIVKSLTTKLDAEEKPEEPEETAADSSDLSEEIVSVS